MTPRRRRLPRPVLAVIAVILATLAVTLLVAGGLAAPDTLVIGLASLFYVVPGLVVLVKRDWHLIGWLLLLTGTAFAAQIGLSQAYPDGLASSMNQSWVAWLIEGWLVNAVFTGVIALIVLFPEGLRDRPARQRLTGRLTLGLAVALVLAPMLTRDVGGGTQFAKIPNPTGLGFLPNSIIDVGFPIQVLLAATSLIGFWLRYRRTFGAERAQYRWVGYAFGLVIVGLLIGVAYDLFAPNSDVLLLPLLIAIYLIPVSFSLAIVRYGLYEIDRIISRTVTYAGVAVVVAGVYALPVLSLPHLLGESNSLVVAASTLAAAAVFNPVRRRIQRAVDHRFNRARYNAELEVNALSSRLEDAVDLPSMTNDLGQVLDRTLSPEHRAVWIRTVPAGHEST